MTVSKDILQSSVIVNFRTVTFEFRYSGEIPNKVCTISRHIWESMHKASLRSSETQECGLGRAVKVQWKIGKSLTWVSSPLKCWDLDRMAEILQTFSNTFRFINIFIFLFNSQWGLIRISGSVNIGSVIRSHPLEHLREVRQDYCLTPITSGYLNQCCALMHIPGPMT